MQWAPVRAPRQAVCGRWVSCFGRFRGIIPFSVICSHPCRNHSYAAFHSPRVEQMMDAQKRNIGHSAEMPSQAPESER